MIAGSDLIFDHMQARDMLPAGAAKALCYGGDAEERRRQLTGLFDVISAAAEFADQPDSLDFVSAVMALDLPTIDRLAKLLRPGGSIALRLTRRCRSYDMQRIAAILRRNGVWQYDAVGPDLVVGRKMARVDEAPRPARLTLVSSR